MVPVLGFLVPLGIVISVFSAWTLSAGRHANTLLEGVPAVAIAIAVLMFPGAGTEPLIWGTVAGFCFHTLSLAIPLSRRNELEAPTFAQQSPHWPSFWNGFGIVLAGQVLISFAAVVDPFFAAHLAPGSIATLNYANRLLALILGLGATAINRATLPVFSSGQTLGSASAQRVAKHWVHLLFVLGIAAMVIGWLIAHWTVALLFERGAFTAADTAAVAGVLRFGLAQLPFYFSAMVLVSFVSSQRRYKLLFWTGVTGIGAKLLGNAILIPWFGVNGIALAWALVYAVNAIFLWYAVWRSS
jgi:peptidoglycan biosynthesis protein MviN/MurJ (putative lipid II flippase)